MDTKIENINKMTTEGHTSTAQLAERWTSYYIHLKMYEHMHWYVSLNNFQLKENINTI